MQKVEQVAVLRIRETTDWKQLDNVITLRDLCQVSLLYTVICYSETERL